MPPKQAADQVIHEASNVSKYDFQGHGVVDGTVWEYNLNEDLGDKPVTYTAFRAAARTFAKEQGIEFMCAAYEGHVSKETVISEAKTKDLPKGTVVIARVRFGEPPAE